MLCARFVYSDTDKLVIRAGSQPLTPRLARKPTQSNTLDWMFQEKMCPCMSPSHQMAQQLAHGFILTTAQSLWAAATYCLLSVVVCFARTSSAACLANRHGEDYAQAVESGEWVCPPCRGTCGPGCVSCCNCGPCRRKVCQLCCLYMHLRACLCLGQCRRWHLGTCAL